MAARISSTLVVFTVFFPGFLFVSYVTLVFRICASFQPVNIHVYVHISTYNYIYNYIQLTKLCTQVLPTTFVIFVFFQSRSLSF